jgi:CRISPR/Cas system endoribonuclease Cas6 (RAMP superfamily)
VQRITIRFLTPTFLRADGEVVRRPEFHHVVKRLRDRINALSTFFGDGPLDLNFRGLGERAEKVRTVSAQIDWVERYRTSSKTRQRHELSGFVGEATYEGELSEFLPWFALGEIVHVGKHTAWGNGWIKLSVAPARDE